MDTATLNYKAPAPLSERINLRMIVFLVAMLCLLGYPIWVYVDSFQSGGIKPHSDGYTEVDLKAMSTFPFDQENGRIDDIPRKWRDLDGKKVRVFGEMWSSTSAAPAIKKFDVVYSIAKCCFSGPPQIQHFVQSTAPKPVPYYSGLVEVKGTLHVNVKQGDGKIASVYQLDVEQVKPVDG